jgi:hypothetical protein
MVSVPLHAVAHQHVDILCQQYLKCGVESLWPAVVGEIAAVNTMLVDM